MRRRIHIAVVFSAILCGCSTHRSSPTPSPIASTAADDSTGQSIAVTRAPVASSRVPPGELAGIVVDAATGKPLAQSQVFTRANSRATFTDSLGRFRISLPPGSNRVSVGRIGHSRVDLDVATRTDSGLVVVVALHQLPVRLCYISVSIPSGPAGVTATMHDAITGRAPSTTVTMVVNDGSFADSTTARITGDGRVIVIVFNNFR